MLKVKDITIMGVFLSIIIIGKLMDLFLPHLPGGLDEGTAILPLIIISGSILIGFKRAIVPVVLYVFVVMWIGSGIFMQPLASASWISKHSSMNQAEVYSGIYFLDYVIPLFVLTLPSLFKSKRNIIIASLISIITNYLFHVLSGYVIWSSFGSMWGMAMIVYSFIGNGVRFLFLLITSLLITSVLIKNKKHIVQNGYVNNSFKVKINGNYYQKRVPKFSVADWENEKNVYKNLGIEVDFKENGVFYKPWVDGKTVKRWNRAKIDSLSNKIKSFHKRPTKGIVVHDWAAYDGYKNMINKDIFDDFKKNIKSISKEDMVLSHNDINRNNVLWNGMEIILIDFEWSRVNTKYFDYAQFEVAEGVKILPKNMSNKKYELVFSATIVYSLLWTYSMPDSKKIIKLRKKYSKMIKDKQMIN